MIDIVARIKSILDKDLTGTKGFIDKELVFLSNRFFSPHRYKNIEFVGKGAAGAIIFKLTNDDGEFLRLLTLSKTDNYYYTTIIQVPSYTYDITLPKNDFYLKNNKICRLVSNKEYTLESNVDLFSKAKDTMYYLKANILYKAELSSSTLSSRIAIEFFNDKTIIKLDGYYALCNDGTVYNIDTLNVIATGVKDIMYLNSYYIALFYEDKVEVRRYLNNNLEATHSYTYPLGTKFYPFFDDTFALIRVDEKDMFFNNTFYLLSNGAKQKLKINLTV